MRSYLGAVRVMRTRDRALIGGGALNQPADDTHLHERQTGVLSGAA